MKQSKGFTLIELLVVIAIIGILSSIVLASLNTARQRGADAAIKGALSGLRAEVEIQADGGGYATACTNAVTFLASAQDNGPATTTTTDGTVQTSTSVYCHDTESAWVASAPLGSSSNYFCVDSTGAAKEVATLQAANSTVCSAS